MIHMKHPSGIDQRIVDKMVARRGSLHRFTTLDPKNTLLVVIDLDVRTVEMDPRLREIVGTVNRVARALREAGGRVAWVTTPINADNVGFYRNVLGDGMVRHMTGVDDLDEMEQEEYPDGSPLPLNDGLNVHPNDIQAVKNLYSAFVSGGTDLIHLILADREDVPETILFAGTVTNVCVESSVRDAAELGLKAIVISDAVIGHSYGAHEASLAVMYRNFGDVRPSSEVVDLLIESDS